MNILQQIDEAKKYLQKEVGSQAFSIGIVMGTGLEKMAEKISIQKVISYSKIPHFPTATVSFHKCNLIVGTIGNQHVMAMQGRFHYYEGYTMQQITFPVRLMKSMGVDKLLLSNAAGAMNLQFKKGDLMLIEDHINLLPDNPLRGVSNPLLGERFVDMSEPYDKNLREQFLSVARENQIRVQKGVYVSVMGPNLETRAEYRWLRSMGADAVGMSTVPEVIVANQCGMKCMAVSVLTDECDPDNLKPVNIAEIIAVAGKADEQLSNLFVQFIEGLV